MIGAGTLSFLPAIAHLGGRLEQGPNVVHRSPHLRHAAFNRPAACRQLPSRVRTEYSVVKMQSRSFVSANWPMKAKLTAPFGHHIRAVAGLARHEESGDVGHHHRHRPCAGRGQLGNLPPRDAQMVEPLLRDLLAGAVLHRLFHDSRRACPQTANRTRHDLALRLLLEMRLAVHGPTAQPAGVPDGYDASADHLAAERIALDDPADVFGDALIERGDRGRFPLGLAGCGRRTRRGARRLRPSQRCAATVPMPGAGPSLSFAGV